MDATQLLRQLEKKTTRTRWCKGNDRRRKERLTPARQKAGTERCRTRVKTRQRDWLDLRSTKKTLGRSWRFRPIFPLQSCLHLCLYRNLRWPRDESGGTICRCHCCCMHYCNRDVVLILDSLMCDDHTVRKLSSRRFFQSANRFFVA